jgi:CRISPR-associated protein Cas2
MKKAKETKELTFYERIMKIKKAGLNANTDLITPLINNELLPLSERLPLVDEILKNFKNRRTDDMYAFIMYDIENNKIRTQVAKYLIQNGCTRVQKSVFLANIKRKKFMEVYQTLKEINTMYDNHDSLFFVAVGEDILNNMKIVGQNIDFELITNTPNTMFI